jgi:ABC-2 type transport system ATP-binding protein
MPFSAINQSRPDPALPGAASERGFNSMNASAAVETENLSLSYGTRRALANVSFAVDRGEIFGLLGPNGGGKTTLFRILSTLLPPTSGRAAIFGQDVVSQSREVRRRVGVVFQGQNLDRKLTVTENLTQQGHLYGMRGRSLRERIEQLLTALELRDRRHDRVETLSGGQRRRVEVAKGLLHDPALLLLDEPSTGLDPSARRTLWDAWRLARATEGVTILLTTHLLEEAEQCDRLAILDDGKLVALGTPDSLKQEIGGEVILVNARQPEALRDQLQQRFAVEVTLLGSALRFERARGHEFIPQLVEAFPGEIQSVTVARPTLEDVFFRRTGHSFWESSALNGRGGAGSSGSGR